jgi:mono/diheme cytochrome c family protein
MVRHLEHRPDTRTTDRTERRGRRSFALLALALGILAGAWGVSACSSGSVPADPTLAKGKEVFDANCASCHGPTGGGGVGPRLVGIGTRMTEEQEIAKITNGVSGTSMPAWGSRLSAEEIEAVSAYTRSLTAS